MSFIKAAPAIAQFVLLSALERSSFTMDDEENPDPESFTIVGNLRNGTGVRYKCTPHALQQVEIGDGTPSRPNPARLTDPSRKFVLCLAKQPGNDELQVLRVDMFREQNISYGFKVDLKSAHSTRVQDKDVEVEIADNEYGDVNIVSVPSHVKTDEHALPIIRALSKATEIKVGAELAGKYRISRLEGRKAYITVL